MATVEWHDQEAELVDLVVGVEDPALLAAITASDKAGIDCPLGWPDPFVDFVTQHHARGDCRRSGASPGVGWRRTLSRRATDVHVARTTGVTPRASPLTASQPWR